MRLPKFDFFEPSTIQEALPLLNSGNARILAGGTDLMVALKRRLETPEALISLHRIKELDYIVQDEGFLKIGSMTTLKKIVNSATVNKLFPALAQASWEVASPLLHGQATIGGNLCLNTRCRYYNQSEFWRQSQPTCYKAGGESCLVTNKQACYAAFSGDLAPILLAWGADISIATAEGMDKISLKEFYTNDSKSPNKLAANSKGVLTEIKILLEKAQWSSLYTKARLRGSIDFPLVGAGLSIDLDPKNKLCRGAAIVATGVGSGPVAVNAAEEMIGHELTGELITSIAEKAAAEIHPVRTGRVSPRYQRSRFKTLVIDGLKNLTGLAD